MYFKGIRLEDGGWLLTQGDGKHTHSVALLNLLMNVCPLVQCKEVREGPTDGEIPSGKTRIAGDRRKGRTHLIALYIRSNSQVFPSYRTSDRGVDKRFLDGFECTRKHRDAQWDRDQVFASDACAPQVRRMPTGFRDMHPSSGHTLAEILQTLGAKLTQEADSIRWARTLSLASHTDARSTIDGRRLDMPHLF